MMSESYHKKKQGGGKVITSVKSSEPLLLHIRIGDPKNKVGAQTA